MALPDRLEALLAQNDLTGIDFVFVHADQVQIDVFFLKRPAHCRRRSSRRRRWTRSASGAEDGTSLALTATWQTTPDGRDFLRIVTAAPGDFGPYTCASTTRASIRSSTTSSSASRRPARATSTARRRRTSARRSHASTSRSTIIARDFWSLRGALLEFAAQRYPEWQDRLEADVGVMLAEVMSALGDEFAVHAGPDRARGRTRDRDAAPFGAPPRAARRLRRPRRPRRGDWLDVTAAAAGALPAGTPVQAVPDALATGDLVSPVTPDGPNPDGAPLPVTFEIGRGLADMDRPGGPAQFAIDPARNALRAAPVGRVAGVPARRRDASSISPATTRRICRSTTRRQGGLRAGGSCCAPTRSTGRSPPGDGSCASSSVDGHDRPARRRSAYRTQRDPHRVGGRAGAAVRARPGRRSQCAATSCRQPPGAP